MNIFLIITICSCILAIISAIFSIEAKKDEYKNLFLICAMMFSFIWGNFSIAYGYERTPSAIDVYRGDTELNIKQTVENGVVIENDTTIVFKNSK